MGSRYKRYSINPQPPKKQAVFPRPMMANLGHPGFIASYPLVMTNSLPWNITMLSNHLFLWAIFHGELLNNQRVFLLAQRYDRREEIEKITTGLSFLLQHLLSSTYWLLKGGSHLSTNHWEQLFQL